MLKALFKTSGLLAFSSVLILLSTWSFSAQVGVSPSGSAPHPSAALDVNFQDRGFLLPRMTTAQRNAIANPAEALMIYNTTTDCIEAYSAVNAEWVCLGYLGCTFPGVPSAGAATGTAATSFTANWSSAPGATGYLLDVSTSSQFTSFVTGYQSLQVGNVTSASVVGLTCGTTYFYRVRALNDCGASAHSSSIQVATAPCCIVQTIAAGATSSNIASGQTQITINRPSGTVSGNLLLACITTSGGLAGTPSGWTLIQHSTGGNCGSSTFYRIAGASEPASYSFPFAGQTWSSGLITRFTNVDPANPINVNAVQEAQSGYVLPTITTTVNNAMLVAAFSSGNGGNTWTAPGGYSTALAGGLNSTSTGLFYRIQAAAGSSSPASSSPSINDNGHMHHIALRPVCQ